MVVTIWRNEPLFASHTKPSFRLVGQRKKITSRNKKRISVLIAPLLGGSGATVYVRRTACAGRSDDAGGSFRERDDDRATQRNKKKRKRKREREGLE